MQMQGEGREMRDRQMQVRGGYNERDRYAGGGGYAGAAGYGGHDNNWRGGFERRGGYDGSRDSRDSFADRPAYFRSDVARETPRPAPDFKILRAGGDYGGDMAIDGAGLAIHGARPQPRSHRSLSLGDSTSAMRDASDAVAAVASERSELNEDTNPRKLEDGNNPAAPMNASDMESRAMMRGAPPRNHNDNAYSPATRVYSSSSHDPNDQVFMAMAAKRASGCGEGESPRRDSPSPPQPPHPKVIPDKVMIMKRPTNDPKEGAGNLKQPPANDLKAAAGNKASVSNESSVSVSNESSVKYKPPTAKGPQGDAEDARSAEARAAKRAVLAANLKPGGPVNPVKPASPQQQPQHPQHHPPQHKLGQQQQACERQGERASQALPRTSSPVGTPEELEAKRRAQALQQNTPKMLTRPDALSLAPKVLTRPERPEMSPHDKDAGTRFSCFTGTKVQILMQLAEQRRVYHHTTRTRRKSSRLTSTTPSASTGLLCTQMERLGCPTHTTRLLHRHRHRHRHRHSMK